MISFKTNKFKKGDKVVCVGNTSADGVEFGEVYTVKNPSSHLGFYNGKLHNYVTLEEDDVVTPNEDCLELYIEPRNYRNMKPTDLIKVSIDGFEDEIPLGDLIHARALVGNSKGTFGYNLYKFLGKLDEDDVDYVHEASEAQKEADKANLRELFNKLQIQELQAKRKGKVIVDNIILKVSFSIY